MKMSEARSYILFCLKRPRAWLEVGVYVWGRFLLKSRDSLFRLAGKKDRLHHYPGEIRELIKKIDLSLVPSPDWFTDLPGSGWEPGQGPAFDSWTIPLATASLSPTNIAWSQQYDDAEDFFALHRFGWLLRWLSLSPPTNQMERAQAVILDWIEQVKQGVDQSAWETYSVAERVVNWLLFFAATRNHTRPDQREAVIISGALRDHIRFILLHLEYHGTLCNNHILNNARALYAGGVFLKMPQVAEIGRQLFRRHTAEMITADGLLLEGSSHYQLLLTRTFMEVLWIADSSNDRAFVEQMKPVASTMLASCDNLFPVGAAKVGAEFPLLGDVSPDYPVSWFTPLTPEKRNPESWWNLWDGIMKNLVEEQKKVVSPRQSVAGGIVIRGENNRHTLFVPKVADNQPYPTAHGHLDFGGFSFYDQWGAVLVDRGRYSYRADELGSFGYTARAHNTSLINGTPLLPPMVGILKSFREYLHEKYTTISVSADDTTGTVAWQTTAVERIAESLTWKKDLAINPQGIVLHEEVRNPDSQRLALESYLHFAPGWKIDRLEGGNGDYEFKVKNAERAYVGCVHFLDGSAGTLEFAEGPEDRLAGWHFPDYGEKVVALTLTLSASSKRDFSWQLEMRQA